MCLWFTSEEMNGTMLLVSGSVFFPVQLFPTVDAEPEIRRFLKKVEVGSDYPIIYDGF